MEKLEPELGAGGTLDCAQDWGSKLAGAVARIAGVMHYVIHAYSDPWLYPLAATTMQSAIKIGQYATTHALVAFEAMQADHGLSDAQYVLRWMERHNKQEFAKSEAQQHGKRRFKQASDIDTPLALLVRHNYIRLKPTTKHSPGRPASPIYEVNPAFRPNGLVEKCSENSKKADSTPDQDNLQNIQSAYSDMERDNCISGNGRVKVEI